MGRPPKAILHPDQLGLGIAIDAAPAVSAAPTTPVPHDIPRVLGPGSLEEVYLLNRYVSMKELNLASSNEAGAENNHIPDRELLTFTRAKVEKRIHCAVKAYLTSEIAIELQEEGWTLGRALSEHAKGEMTKGAALAALITNPNVRVRDLPFFQSDEMKIRAAGTANYFLKEFARRPGDSSRMARFKLQKRATIIQEVKRKVKREHPRLRLPDRKQLDELSR